MAGEDDRVRTTSPGRQRQSRRWRVPGWKEIVGSNQKTSRASEENS